jgi:glycosyltransferase involved in cell wall biosynthesis
METIRSALNQTQPFAEIIVVDDASTDNTLEKLAEFGNLITVIPSSKIGVQRARNMGVSTAKSQYVTLCDSDDILLPEFVEETSKWLSGHPDCDSVYVNYRSFTETKIENDILSGAPRGFFDGAVVEGNFIHSIPDVYARTVRFQPFLVSGVTIKKSFYEAIGGFDPAFDRVPAEDWEYTLRALSLGHTVMCTIPLVRIRHHDGNDSRNGLRQALGEVEVLKYALKHHKAASIYREQLIEGINQRTDEVFYKAFRKGNFSVAGAVFPLLENRPRSFKFKLKRAILKFHGIFYNYDLRTSLNLSVPSETTGVSHQFDNHSQP